MDLPIRKLLLGLTTLLTFTESFLFSFCAGYNSLSLKTYYKWQFIPQIYATCLLVSLFNLHWFNSNFSLYFDLSLFFFSFFFSGLNNSTIQKICILDNATIMPLIENYLALDYLELQFYNN